MSADRPRLRLIRGGRPSDRELAVVIPPPGEWAVAGLREMITDVEELLARENRRRFFVVQGGKA